jgi:predicted RNA-binding protein YlqC (UPF0109 family)
MASVESPTHSNAPQSASSQILSVRILSSNKDIGKLIGEHGRDISAVREQCAAVLHISELNKGVRERILTIKGNAEQIEDAFVRVTPKFALAAVAAAEEEDPQTPVQPEQVEMTVTLLIPNLMAGRIIGKAGEKIKSIKQESGANVSVANEPIDNTTERRVMITGTCQAVQAAFRPILATLSEHSARVRDAQMVYYTPGVSMVPSNFLSPLLLGGQMPNMAARGPTNGNRKAVVPVPMALAGQEQILTIQINVPAQSIGAILGKRGQNIREIRRQSAAEITVAETAVGAERSIIIKGNLHQNELALYLIQSTLANAPAAKQKDDDAQE